MGRPRRAGGFARTAKRITFLFAYRRWHRFKQGVAQTFEIHVDDVGVYAVDAFHVDFLDFIEFGSGGLRCCSCSRWARGRGCRWRSEFKVNDVAQQGLRHARCGGQWISSKCKLGFHCRAALKLKRWHVDDGTFAAGQALSAFDEGGGDRDTRRNFRAVAE